MNMKKLREAAKKRPIDIESIISKYDNAVHYLENKYNAGVINLENDGTLFTEQLIKRISLEYQLNKEEVLKLSGCNLEVFSTISEMIGKIINSIIDFIVKLFGGNSNEKTPKSKEKKQESFEKHFNADAFKKLKDKDVPKYIVAIGKHMDSLGIDGVDSTILDMYDEINNIVDGKDDKVIESNVKGDLLSKAIHITKIPKEFAGEKIVHRYVLYSWKVKENKIKYYLLNLQYLNNTLVYIKKVSVDYNITITDEYSEDDLKHQILKFYYDKKMQDNMESFKDKLIKLNKKIKDKKTMDKIVDRYKNKKISVLDHDVYMRAIGNYLSATPTYYSILHSYNKKALSLMDTLSVDNANMESDTSVDFSPVVDNEKESMLLQELFNLESGTYAPSQYNDTWKYLKSIGQINVKTAANTQLKARLLFEQIGKRDVPLRLNKELAKLHFLWVLSKDYGIRLSDIMIGYQGINSTLASYINGDAKAAIKTNYGQKLINILDPADYKKIPKYDHKLGLYDGKSVKIDAVMVNYNISIQSAKHGRMTYVPYITLLVQLIDIDGVVLKNALISKELKTTVVTKGILNMVVNKILILIRDDQFTNKKVAAYIKSISDVEKSFNAISNGISGSPIMLSYMKAGKNTTEGDVKTNISVGVGAVLAMTKNVVEYDRLKNYFLNEVARKTINQ